MPFLFANQAMGLSFTQLRKLHEFREYRYAQDAAYSLKHSTPEPFALTNEVARDHGHIPGTLKGLKLKGSREGNVEEKASNKVRWADRVEKAAMERQRVDSDIRTDEARRALIAGLAREWS